MTQEVTCRYSTLLSLLQCLTTNKFTIDSATIHTYGPFSADEVIFLAAYASRTKNQDAINTSVIAAALGHSSRARAGIKLLGVKPFNPAGKHMDITYLEVSSGKLREGTYPLISLTQRRSLCQPSRPTGAMPNGHRDAPLPSLKESSCELWEGTYLLISLTQLCSLHHPSRPTGAMLNGHHDAPSHP
jgi:hypothetical protein